MNRLLPASLLCAATLFAQKPYNSWTSAHGPDSIHYSALKQINRTNVKQLRVAWTYETGDSFPWSQMQCNPIIVDGIMYATSPKLRVVAVNAATGKEVWTFTPFPKGDGPRHPNRGVMHWTDGKQSRIFVTIGPKLYSLDAKTGKPDPHFGTNGAADLRTAFDRPAETVDISSTSPGVVYKDLVILGSAVPENLPSTPGDIRAYDVHTGALRWSFHTIPHPGEPGYETWPKDAWKTTGGANAWAGLAVDQTRGLVYVPTGSAAFDFYGADRVGDNLYANSLICLDAATGKYKWHFQAIKHDVWDLDFPQAPALVTVKRNGKSVDAVAVSGKTGYLYLFDRVTGESLFPFRDVQARASAIAGESVVTTQRLPAKPEPFSRQGLTEDLVTDRTPEVHEKMLAAFRQMKSGLFTPPSMEGTIEMPAFSGGAEWGGSAYDPETHIYYVNANDMPWVSRLTLSKTTAPVDSASNVYQSRCAVCHRADRKGAPPEFPAVDNLKGQRTPEQLVRLLLNGNGRMPSFKQLGSPAINAVVSYLLDGKDEKVPVGVGKSDNSLPYTFAGYQKFLDPEGYPGVKPPWGTLNAINLDTGDYVFRRPLGEYPQLAAKGIKDTGCENHGGGIVTAGGLFFISATEFDKKIRAFDKMTGELLWEYTLPASGNATPAMYEIKGKQYLVIAAGGGKSFDPSGGSYIAFALP